MPYLFQSPWREYPKNLNLKKYGQGTQRQQKTPSRVLTTPWFACCCLAFALTCSFSPATTEGFAKQLDLGGCHLSIISGLACSVPYYFSLLFHLWYTVSQDTQALSIMLFVSIDSTQTLNSLRPVDHRSLDRPHHLSLRCQLSVIHCLFLMLGRNIYSSCSFGNFYWDRGNLD